MTRRAWVYVGVIILCIFALVALSGCAGQPGDQAYQDGLEGMRSGYVTMPDGDAVPCITFESIDVGGAGITCDWSAATREGEPVG